MIENSTDGNSFLKKKPFSLLALYKICHNVVVSLINFGLHFTFTKERNVLIKGFFNDNHVMVSTKILSNLDFKNVNYKLKKKATTMVDLIKYYRWWLWEWSDQARKMFSSRKLRKLYDWTYPSDFRFSPTTSELSSAALRISWWVKLGIELSKQQENPTHISSSLDNIATENCLGNSHPVLCAPRLD